MTAVSINLEKLREKLNKVQRKDKGGKKDFDKNLWFFPEDQSKIDGPNNVRLIPWSDQPDMPIKELAFYYGIRTVEEQYGGKMGKNKALLTLKQFGEADPVQEAIDTLWKKDGKTEDEAKADQELCKKLFPTTTYYFLILVRGKEAEGPKIWQTQSKKIYEKIVKGLLNTSKWGNIMDLSEGRDLEITFDSGKDRDKTDVDFAIKATPAMTDLDELEKMLQETPDPLKLLAKRRKTYDELKAQFDKWLSSSSTVANSEGTEHMMDDEDDEETVSTKSEKSVEKVVDTKKRKSVKEAFADLDTDDE